MLGVVHFLRSFFKVRDVVPGIQNRVCLQSFAGVAEGVAAHAAAPWAVCGWLRGTQERSARQSQLLDGCAGSGGVWPWGLRGRRGKEAHRGLKAPGRGKVDLTEAGETDESPGTPGFLTVLAG